MVKSEVKQGVGRPRLYQDEQEKKRLWAEARKAKMKNEGWKRMSVWIDNDSAEALSEEFGNVQDGLLALVSKHRGIEINKPG